MKKALGILCAVLITTASFAQKSFEGKIIYKTSYKNVPAEMQGMESMMPQGNTIYVDGQKSRMDQDMGMGTSMVVIANSKTDESTIYVDAGMKKIKIEVPKDKAEEMKQENGDMKITYYDDESLQILGYEAKKAIINAGGNEITVYYTEKLPTISANEQFETLKGFPLYYELENSGMTIITQASEIVKDFDKKLLEPLEGYEEITYEEFQQMFQGAGGQ